MIYDTAGDIINAAAIECGLGTTPDPYSSNAQEFVQLRTLLKKCGRELLTAYQWQQLVKTNTTPTTATPPSDGKFNLPSDFGYLINQTGWTPTSSGLGLPLGGPLTRQQYAYLVATNLASSTIYVSFNLNANKLEVLPAPPPANINITYHYMSTGWVDVHGTGTSFADEPVNADDVIRYDSILITNMLVMRWKQAKGFDASAAIEAFQTQWSAITGTNQPAPVLNMARRAMFPYLNMWSNIPQTGFGS